MRRTYFVYILTNNLKTVLYVGVTNNLERRLYEHKTGIVDGFTKKYNVKHLVYCEETNDIESAIQHEKQIKGWSREKKEQLISKSNPHWKDLAENWE